MANTPNRGYPLPDVTASVRDEILRLQQVMLPMFDNDVQALFDSIAGLAAAEHGHVIADITGLVEQFLDDPGLGRGNFQRNLVGFEIDQVFAAADGFARLFVPVQQRRIGNGFGECGDLNFD